MKRKIYEKDLNFLILRYLQHQQLDTADLTKQLVNRKLLPNTTHNVDTFSTISHNIEEDDQILYRNLEQEHKDLPLDLLPKVIENLVDLNDTLKSQIDSPFRLLSSKFMELTNTSSMSCNSTKPNHIPTTSTDVHIFSPNTHSIIIEEKNTEVAIHSPILSSPTHNITIEATPTPAYNYQSEQHTIIDDSQRGSRKKLKKIEKNLVLKATVEDLYYSKDIFGPNHSAHNPNKSNKNNFNSYYMNFMDILTLREYKTPISNAFTRLPFLHSQYRRVKTIEGHSKPSYCCIFDKTGQRLFTGSDDYNIKVWSIQTGLLLYCLRGHMNDITDLSIDPTNRFLASGGNDDQIRIWSLTDCQNYHSHHHSRTLLTNNDATYKFENEIFEEGKECWEYGKNIAVLGTMGDHNPVTIVSFSPNPTSNYLLTINSENNPESADKSVIRIWYTNNWKRPPIEYHSDYFIRTASWFHNGEYFITGCNGAVSIWSVHRGHLRDLVDENNGVVQTLQWNTRNSFIVAGKADGSSAIWKPIYKDSSENINSTIVDVSLSNNHQDGDDVEMEDIDYDRHRERIFSNQNNDNKEDIDEFKKIKNWELIQLIPQNKRRKRGRGVSMCQFTIDGNFAVTALIEGYCLIVWSTQTGKRLHKLQFHTDDIYTLIAHPGNERLMASAGYDGNIFVFDVISGKILFSSSVGSHTLAPSSLHFNAVNNNDVMVVQHNNNNNNNNNNNDNNINNNFGQYSNAAQLPNKYKVTDGNFNSDGSVIAFIDMGGGITIFSLERNKEEYMTTPVSQFLTSETCEIEHDNHGYATVKNFNCPPHQVPHIIADKLGNPYSNLPTTSRGEVPNYTLEILSSLKDRKDLVVESNTGRLDFSRAISEEIASYFHPTQPINIDEEIFDDGTGKDIEDVRKAGFQSDLSNDERNVDIDLTLDNHQQMDVSALVNEYELFNDDEDDDYFEVEARHSRPTRSSITRSLRSAGVTSNSPSPPPPTYRNTRNNKGDRNHRRRRLRKSRSRSQSNSQQLTTTTTRTSRTSLASDRSRRASRRRQEKDQFQKMSGGDDDRDDEEEEEEEEIEEEDRIDIEEEDDLEEEEEEDEDDVIEFDEGSDELSSDEFTDSGNEKKKEKKTPSRTSSRSSLRTRRKRVETEEDHEGDDEYHIDNQKHDTNDTRSRMSPRLRNRNEQKKRNRSPPRRTSSRVKTTPNKSDFIYNDEKDNHHREHPTTHKMSTRHNLRSSNTGSSSGSNNYNKSPNISNSKKESHVSSEDMAIWREEMISESYFQSLDDEISELTSPRNTTTKALLDLPAWMIIDNLKDEKLKDIAISYIPQLGDEVVYIVDAHIDYNNEFPALNSELYTKLKSNTEFGFLYCSIHSIEYKFFNQTYYARITLKVQKEKNFHIPFRTLRSRKSKYSNEDDELFQVNYHPAGIQDFLVLSKTFDYCREHNGKPGQFIRMFFPDPYYGLIKETKHCLYNSLTINWVLPLNVDSTFPFLKFMKQKIQSLKHKNSSIANADLNTNNTSALNDAGGDQVIPEIKFKADEDYASFWEMNAISPKYNFIFEKYFHSLINTTNNNSGNKNNTDIIEIDNDNNDDKNDNNNDNINSSKATPSSSSPSSSKIIIEEGTKGDDGDDSNNNMEKYDDNNIVVDELKVYDEEDDYFMIPQMQHINESDNNILLSIWEKLDNIDIFDLPPHFYKPRSERNKKAISDVTYPASYHLILSRLRNHYYRHLNGLRYDVDLMFNNAKKYNVRNMSAIAQIQDAQTRVDNLLNSLMEVNFDTSIYELPRVTNDAIKLDDDDDDDDDDEEEEDDRDDDDDEDEEVKKENLEEEEDGGVEEQKRKNKNNKNDNKNNKEKTEIAIRISSNHIVEKNKENEKKNQNFDDNNVIKLDVDDRKEDKNDDDNNDEDDDEIVDEISDLSSPEVGSSDDDDDDDGDDDDDDDEEDNNQRYSGRQRSRVNKNVTPTIGRRQNPKRAVQLHKKVNHTLTPSTKSSRHNQRKSKSSPCAVVTPIKRSPRLANRHYIGDQNVGGNNKIAVGNAMFPAVKKEAKEARNEASGDSEYEHKYSSEDDGEVENDDSEYVDSSNPTISKKRTSLRNKPPRKRFR